MRMRPLRAWLTSLYPRDWRDRYGAEFEALLEESLRTPMDVFDVFLGALDAHLQLFNGDSVTWRILNTMNKLRTAILVVFTAFIGFVLAGMALVGIADDSPMIPLMQTNLTLRLSWTALQTAAVIALLAIVTGGLPLTIRLFRQALRVNRRILKMLAVPVIAFVAFGATFAFVVLVSRGVIALPGVVQVVQPGNFPTGNRLLLAGLMLVFVLGAVASTWAVWKAVSGLDESVETTSATNGDSARMYRFAFVPAVIASAAMLVMLASTLVWGVTSFEAFPQVYAGNFGPWQTSTQAWYFSIVALMLLCMIAAFSAVGRGRKALGAQ